MTIYRRGKSMEETETLSRAEFSAEIEDHFANALSANETGDPGVAEFLHEQLSDLFPH